MNKSILYVSLLFSLFDDIVGVAGTAATAVENTNNKNIFLIVLRCVTFDQLLFACHCCNYYFPFYSMNVHTFIHTYVCMYACT